MKLTKIESEIKSMDEQLLAMKRRRLARYNRDGAPSTEKYDRLQREVRELAWQVEQNNRVSA